MYQLKKKTSYHRGALFLVFLHLPAKLLKQNNKLECKLPALKKCMCKITKRKQIYD